jgi:hypothetical protein
MCTQNENPSPETELPELVVGQEPIPGGFEPVEAESALEALEPTLMAIPRSEVRQLKVSVTNAVGIGLAYARAYAEDRPLFESSFTPETFDVSAHDNMAGRAKAFWRADILMRQAINTEGPFRLLVSEAKPLRQKLMKAARYLWGEDEELGDVVASIRKGQGYANRADDLGSLAALFTEHWDQAEGECGVKLEDIAAAEELGARILEAMSPSKAQVVEDVRSLRHRAGEYLRRGIEEVRWAATYVFRHTPGELERYPSLFKKRKKRSSSGKHSSETASEAQAQLETPGETTLDHDLFELPLTTEEANPVADIG